jgi:hypothetical protein
MRGGIYDTFRKAVQLRIGISATFTALDSRRLKQGTEDRKFVCNPY